MENLILTQVSRSELRRMLREELKSVLLECYGQFEKQEKGKQSEYMDIEQLSSYIGRTVASIRGLVQRRKIPVIKQGKRLSFEKAEIDQWMKDATRHTMKQLDNEAKDFTEDEC